jgi:hypothetical protein
MPNPTQLENQQSTEPIQHSALTTHHSPAIRQIKSLTANADSVQQLSSKQIEKGGGNE